MFSVYDPCPCSSGKKFKFCCYLAMKASDDESFAKLSLEWPLRDCFVLRKWKEIGKTMLCIVREMPNKHFCAIFFLLDVLCFGVKDAYIRPNLDNKDLVIIKDGIDAAGEGGIVEISYEDARSLIFGSLEYAASIGFSPHYGWKKVQYAVEPERPFVNKFEFGENGKPLYVQGPFDKEQLNVKEIIKKVIALGGRWEINMEEGYKG